MNNEYPNLHKSRYQILSIKLSEEGKGAIYAAFPDEALSYADDNYNPDSIVKDPYFTYKELCISYCRTNGVNIDFKALNSIHPSKMLEAVHKQSWTKGSSVSSHSSRRNSNQQREAGSLQQRLTNSHTKYQTVMRPFYGLPDTLHPEETKELSQVEIEPLPLHHKEPGNGNELPGRSGGNTDPKKDGGFSSDYCMQELNFFSLQAKEKKIFGNQKIIVYLEKAIGDRKDYLDTAIKNWTQQYMFALDREKDE